MEPRETDSMWTLRRPRIRSGQLPGISVALSGMMAAWSIGVLLEKFTPHHSTPIMLFLIVGAGIADVVVLKLMEGRLRRFKNFIENDSATALKAIRADLESRYPRMRPETIEEIMNEVKEAFRV